MFPERFNFTNDFLSQPLDKSYDNSNKIQATNHEHMNQLTCYSFITVIASFVSYTISVGEHLPLSQCTSYTFKCTEQC